MTAEPPDDGAGPDTRRRGILIAGAAAIAAAALGGVVLLGEKLAWWKSTPAQASPIEQLADSLTARFDYLTLDRPSLLRYLADYQTAYGPLERSARSRQTPPLDLFFLESSDFFVHGGDESRTVAYVALRDPYINPCVNPFRSEAG